MAFPISNRPNQFPHGPGRGPVPIPRGSPVGRPANNGASPSSKPNDSRLGSAPPNGPSVQPFPIPPYVLKHVEAPAVGPRPGTNRSVSLAYGTGSTQGPRPTMEDAHFAYLKAKEVDRQPLSIFGVLDGHCGRRVADLGAQFIPSDFIAHPQAGKNNADALIETIIRSDHKIFHTIGRQDGGSTAIVAVVHGRQLSVACLGDARAVLCDGNTAIPMSIDHKPGDPGEQQRIVRCGGVVHFGRVGGCLAVSRALGDFEFKFNGPRMQQREFQVSNVPDVRQYTITDSSNYLILACDGLWDVMTNEEAVSWVNAHLQKINEKDVVVNSRGGMDRTKLLRQCAQELALAAIRKGSQDNVSVTLIAFHEWSPKK